MSVSTPPTKTATRTTVARLTPGRLALALSLMLHIGVSVAFTRAALSSRPPLSSLEPGQPYTARTYASKVDDAKAQLKKLAEVANALETLKKEKEPSPSSTPPGDDKALKQAAQEAHAAQSEASKSLKNKALEPARAAQAKAFLAQDRLHQALLRPTERPKMAAHQKALETVRRALEQQAAAQSALRQAQEALRQAARAKTPEAQVRAAEALKKAQTAQQAAAKAQEPVIEQVRVAHYDREKTPPPPGHPSGPKNRIIVASTRVEEKAARAIPQQEQAQSKLQEAKAALERNDNAGAKKAVEAAQALQRQVRDDQKAAQKALVKDGETIPGKEDAQKTGLRQAKQAQQKATDATNAAQAALKQDNSKRALAALEKAQAAQAAAATKQEAVVASLQGAFGPKTAAPKLDAHHVHGPECFAPGGT